MLIAGAVQGAVPPNIILLLADDMGYGDLQCLNPDSPIPTPNMDQLAAEGMTFTDAHTASSVCTPTRYSILTGRYAWRSRLKKGVLWPYDRPLISVERLTLPKMLQQQGYHTACIGKWHLGMDWPSHDGSSIHHTDPVMKTGPATCAAYVKKLDFSQPIKNGPTARGFDHYFGVTCPNFPPYCFIENDRTVGLPTIDKPDNMYGQPGPMLPGWKLEDILPTLGEKAVSYIETQAKTDQPFFLYFACTAPHTPILPAADFIEKTTAGPYGDLVHQVDWTFGQIMKTLDEQGIADTTIVILSSDNGSSTRAGDKFVHGKKFAQKQAVVKLFGHNPSYIYRGFKWSIYEGGHRVPFIVRWPGKIEAGSKSDLVVCSTDLMATIAAMVDAKLPRDAAEDSYDVSSVLLGTAKDEIRPATVHHGAQGEFSLRKGRWKMIEQLDSKPMELFDVKSDPSEKHDISAQHPEIVTELLSILNGYRTNARSTK